MKGTAAPATWAHVLCIAELWYEQLPRNQPFPKYPKNDLQHQHTDIQQQDATQSRGT